MPNYLLEIGVEELPADQVPEAQERLKSLMSEALEQANVSFEEISTFGTTRRVACIVKGMAGVQATTHKKVKGPPVKSSFNAEGEPLPAAAGFAQKQGLKVDELDREDIGGVTYLIANVTIKGQPASQVLKDSVPAVIEKISGERLMRWGSSSLKFSRPIRWLVSVLDEQEVPVALDGLKSGTESYGHRILAPGKLKVRNSESYKDDLRKACVLVDASERKSLIEQQVKKIAEDVSGVPKQLKGSLLEEVVNITEWPCAVLGEFESEYLDLPDTLIETVMVHHQRYFPIERKDASAGLTGKLLPYFISVANNDREQAKPVIKRGNERVLRARLADGRFFYFDDQKTSLMQRKPALGQLTFHEGLGSYLDKQERLVQAARHMINDLKLEPRVAVCLERTMELCKLDLVTNLVRELPELQGHVGSWYSQVSGEPPDVVTAIASHYSPRSTDDAIPQDTVGKLASVLDKLDNLVSIFALGKRPSGSSDPYALRRQAQGIVDILVDGLDYAVPVSSLIQQLLQLLEPWLQKDKRRQDASQAQADVRDFLIQRLRSKLLDKGFRREVVDAVLSAKDPLLNVPDVITRAKVLEHLISSQGGLDVVRAGVRVGNILGQDSPQVVRPELFSEAAEKDLWQRFNADVVEKWGQGKFKQPVSEQDYQSMLALLKPISPLIDKLFDDVMINDPDKAKRDNRHGLLKQIDVYFRCLADFPKLQPVLL